MVIGQFEVCQFKVCEPTLSNPGLDQISSNGFRCRTLKNGVGFLLNNDTKAAEYLKLNFTQIYEVKKANGYRWIDWPEDQVNGLLSQYRPFLVWFNGILAV